MKELTLISLPVYFESDASYQKKELGINEDNTLDDYDLVDVRLFEFPTGYYVRSFHEKDLVTVIINDRDYITNLTEKEFLTMIAEYFSEEEEIADDNNI
jgi:hypothetical protein